MYCCILALVIGLLVFRFCVTITVEAFIARVPDHKGLGIPTSLHFMVSQIGCVASNTSLVCLFSNAANGVIIYPYLFAMLDISKYKRAVLFNVTIWH